MSHPVTKFSVGCIFLQHGAPEFTKVGIRFFCFFIPAGGVSFGVLVCQVDVHFGLVIKVWMDEDDFIALRRFWTH